MKKLFIGLLTIFGLIITLIFISITITDYDKIYKEFVKNTKVDINLIKSTNFKINASQGFALSNIKVPCATSAKLTVFDLLRLDILPTLY